MILVISGYREFEDYALFTDSLNIFIKQYGVPKKILFGDCRGTDALAKKYVLENKLNYKIYFADWKTHGLSAGPKRNNEMIDIGTHLLAFLDKKSKGTKQAIQYATQNNLTVKIINI